MYIFKILFNDYDSSIIYMDGLNYYNKFNNFIRTVSEVYCLVLSLGINHLLNSNKPPSSINTWLTLTLIYYKKYLFKFKRLIINPF